MKDKFFIFVTIILLALISIRIVSNMPQKEIKDALVEETKEVRSSGIISNLEAVGLKPREAEHYKVVE